MKENSRFSRYALIPVLALGLGLASCEEETVDPVDESGTVYGDTIDLGSGKARTFATLDADGDVTEIGIRMNEAAMEGLPTDTTVFHSYSLALPAEASSTVIEYVMLDWNPAGHPPVGIFTSPHFDMHFYMQTEAETMTIMPGADFQTKAETFPGADYIPEDYFVPPPVEAIPMMGVHWADSTDGTYVPLISCKPFTEVMIYGSWNGKLTFIEPMMTRAWLMTKPTHTEDLKLPAKYQQSGLFPTTYSVKFDATAGEYVITLGGLTERTAS